MMAGGEVYFGLKLPANWEKMRRPERAKVYCQLYYRRKTARGVCVVCRGVRDDGRAICSRCREKRSQGRRFAG